jgi:hypothetical protein
VGKIAREILAGRPAAKTEHKKAVHTHAG